MSELLLQLRDYTHCNQELALTIRKTVLEPFQLDVNNLKKPPPTPSRFKQMASQLAPVAMRIVNQNIDTMKGLKRAMSNLRNYKVVVNCLVDSSFYALAALRHMNTHTTLKALDLEKTTSNLICKMVELGEYNRALEEIVKFRKILAQIAKVSIDKDDKKFKSPSPVSSNRGVLTESNQQQSPPRQLFHPAVCTKNEQDMLNKYGDLFNLPLDTTMRDPTVILLVLAYQMNTLRCWCELNDGSLAKFIPHYMEKPGNFMDWCKHLMHIDDAIASKQLEAFQNLLFKAATRCPLNDDPAYHAYNLQSTALDALAISGSLRTAMDRMVRIGITYEKAKGSTQLSQIQKKCHGFIDSLRPNVDNLEEMDSYFVLCEYYAYIARKTKSYAGTYYAYKLMVRPLIDRVQDIVCPYYYAVYAANAKLALGAVQMTKMVTNDTFANINNTLCEAVDCLRLVSLRTQEKATLDTHEEQALYNLYKSIDTFRQAAKRLFDFVANKTKQSLLLESHHPHKTPPRRGQIATPSDFGEWNTNMQQMNAVLQECSETLPANLQLVKKKSGAKRVTTTTTTENDIMMTWIDILTLLAKMTFHIDDDTSYQQAYDYLATAEQLCSEIKYLTGYRWIASCYYHLGGMMIKTELYAYAVYPLRKSCTLLEKDNERLTTDEGRLQLCKRYEILGTCCQKNERFEDAIKAYRLALKRLPASAIKKFVAKADTTAISALMEQEPLLAKLMDRFLRASVIDPAHQAEIIFASQLLDLTLLTSIEQAVIYECELKIWNMLAFKTHVAKYQLYIVERLLQTYDSEQFPVRRARVLLQQLRIERSRYTADRDDCIRAALSCAEQVIALLKTTEYGHDVNLIHYRLHYMALASSWMTICGRELNVVVSNNFSSTLQQWGMLLKKMTPIYNSSSSSKADIQDVYDSVDDVDEFYDHMRMLADLFGISGQPMYQICALRIMLKLNNGLRHVNWDYVSESIVLSSTIGKIYCDLGYTGKASIEFNQAKKAVSSRPCDNYCEMVYRVYYASYLTHIGDYENSRQVFDATKFTWEHRPQVDTKHHPLTTVKAYVTTSLLLADVYATKSFISASTDSLDIAIHSSTSALYLLNKCVKVTQKSNAERQEKLTQKKTYELENPFMPAPPTSTQQQEERAAKMVFRESQWILAQKISACLITLANLYMKKGAWTEAKYFLSQGPLLAEKVKSNGIFFHSYLCSSDYYLRCGDLDQSQRDLESCLKYQSQGLNHLQDAARLKMIMANLSLANEFYEEAISLYDEVIQAIQKVAGPAYIATIEQLVDIKQEASRDVVFEDEMDRSDAYDCVPLMQLRSINVIQKAFALAHYGHISQAIEMLEQLEESDMIFKNEIELNAAIAKLKLGLLRQELAERPDAHILLNNALVLPSPKVQVQRGGSMVKKGRMNEDILLTMENLNNCLERMTEAHRAGYNMERPSVIQALCLESAFAMFFKNLLTKNTSRVLSTNYSLLVSYYLEMAKGLSMRREMASCLKIKMNKALATTKPSDTKWPYDEKEQEQYNSRLFRSNLNPKWLHDHLESLATSYAAEHEMADSEFQEKFVDILPVNWTVCSLTMDTENQALYAVQMRAGESPFAVKMPLNRTKYRGDEVIQYNKAVLEFQQIIQESDETIQNGSNCTGSEEINAWWKTRNDLDIRLKTLLDSIENQWLSGFKGMLSGRTHEYKEELNKFQKGFTEVVFRSVNDHGSSNKKQIEMNLTLCRMVLRLGQYPTYRDVQDLAYFALSCYESEDVSINYDTFDIKKMTDQINALITKYHDKCSMAGISSNQNIPNDHVILILDKHLQMFPMESLPILRSQSTSRLPCLSFLRDRILFTRAYHQRATSDVHKDYHPWNDFTVSRKSAFYVLNPSGDLKDTQKQFESLFKSVPEWDGVIQEKPMELHCKEALQNRDIYMYFGHSAGQTFMRGTTVRQLPNCAVSLLMGCSSAVLEANGEFDPYGYVLNYLYAGSPAVVANLWDVTDRSIDKLTKHTMSAWGLFKSVKPKSLVQAVTESRSHCKHPYLIGAAPVVYGIPVYVEQEVFSRSSQSAKKGSKLKVLY